MFEIIVVILVILILYIVSSCYIYTKLIGGFYEADDEYLEEAGIDNFSIYIDDCTSNERSCYILMSSGATTVINEPTIAKLSQHFHWSSDLSKPVYFDVEFDMSDEVVNSFPNKQQIKFYPNTGKMVLFNDETIYAVLYKNAVLSELKQIVSEKETDEE